MSCHMSLILGDENETFMNTNDCDLPFSLLTKVCKVNLELGDEFCENIQGFSFYKNT